MKGVGGMARTVLILLVALLQLPARAQSTNDAEVISDLQGKVATLTNQVATLAGELSKATNELSKVTARLEQYDDTNTIISNTVSKAIEAMAIKGPPKRIRVQREAEYLNDQVFGENDIHRARRREAYMGCPRKLLEIVRAELDRPGYPHGPHIATEEHYEAVTNKYQKWWNPCDGEVWCVVPGTEFSTTAYTNKTTVELIEDCHRELKNPDWLYEHIRFGGLVGFLDEVDAVTAQIALRVYAFGYHRHLPGRWVGLENNARRLSFIFAAGPAISRDESLTDDLGIVWTAGLGLDLYHGVSLMAGYSTYPETPKDGDKEWNDSFTFGVALNSELFEGLMDGARR